MRNIATLLLTFLLLTACGDETKFSTPAMQGNKDGDLWRALFYSADIDFGGFIIEGGNNVETLQLITLNDLPGTYNLGGSSASVAVFRDASGRVYSTANAPDPSVSVYPSDGTIIIESVSSTEPKLISGKFNFNAYTADGLHTVNFNEGDFYKVPLLGGLTAIDTTNSCLQATLQLQVAQSNYEATDTTMPDYTSVCNAYKLALNASIAACGDASGVLQVIVDSLGDCLP